MWQTALQFRQWPLATLSHPPEIDQRSAKKVRFNPTAKARRAPPELVEVVDQQGTHFKYYIGIRSGIIHSEWEAAPVIVKKKDGKYRYCIDYRDLNQATRRDSYPLPLIEECLDALAKNQYFSTPDVANGY